MASEKAVAYFKSLKPDEKKRIALEVGISLGRLRNIFYNNSAPSAQTACKIEKAFGGAITRYQIAPDIDWSIFSRE